MSLINQMLKDLEQRRSQDLELPDTPLQGVSRYRVIGDSRPWLAAATISLIVILLAALGWLAWDKFQAESIAAPAEPDTAKLEAVAPKAVAKAATRSPSSPAVTNKAKKKARVSAKTKVTKATVAQQNPAQLQSSDAPLALVEPEIYEQDDVGASGPVQKRIRKLTGKQQAEKSYQAAYSLFSQGRLKAGEAELVKALEYEPRHTRSRELLAGTYIKAGRYVEAGSLLKQGLELQPRHGVFATLYARVLLQQNNIDAAVKVLTAHPPAIKQQPQHYALLAALYQKQGNHQAAVNVYSSLLAHYPQQGVWWIGLGVSQEKLGNGKNASQAFERALETGTLPKRLRKYSDNRISAIKESGYPAE